MSRANEYEILKYNDGVLTWEKDLIVEARRAEIYVNGRPYVSIMATPAQLDYLAIGYLFTEGAINGLADIVNISVEGLKVFAEVKADPHKAPLRSWSCGFNLGSVMSRDFRNEVFRPDKQNPPTISAGRIVELMEEFNNLSELFWKTGAVHSSWLIRGEQRYFSEDVGRHNALDKVIGQFLCGDAVLPDPAGLVFTTGRISTEMLLKTARAGMGALISRGSASRLAVEMAEKLNIVVIGFSKGDQFKALNGGQYISAQDSGVDSNE